MVSAVISVSAIVSQSIAVARIRENGIVTDNRQDQPGVTEQPDHNDDANDITTESSAKQS